MIHFSFVLYEVSYILVRMNNTASRIVETFGGVNAMSEATGIPVTTIRTWLVQGFVGAPKTREYERAILDAAKRLKLQIGPNDFYGEAA